MSYIQRDKIEAYKTRLFELLVNSLPACNKSTGHLFMFWERFRDGKIGILHKPKAILYKLKRGYSLISNGQKYYSDCYIKYSSKKLEDTIVGSRYDLVLRYPIAYDPIKYGNIRPRKHNRIRNVPKFFTVVSVVANNKCYRTVNGNRFYSHTFPSCIFKIKYNTSYLSAMGQSYAICDTEIPLPTPVWPQ